jgi:hypothetical protein
VDLDARASSLWSTSLQEQTGATDPEALREIEDLARSGPRHHAAEMARFRRHARRLTVDGGDRDQLLALLHPNGRDADRSA